MTDYFSLGQILQTTLPVAMSMGAFYAVKLNAVVRGWPKTMVFHARYTSALVFTLAVVISPEASRKCLVYLRPAFADHGPGLAIAVLLALAAVTAAKKISARESVQRNYPLLRTARWSAALHIENTFSWIVYLLAYEFFFRGFLLYSALEFMSAPLAITVNLVIYALAHALKGWKECASSVLFGLILCVLTLATGNIWSAFVIHASLALSTEWFTLRRRPAYPENKYFPTL